MHGTTKKISWASSGRKSSPGSCGRTPDWYSNHWVTERLILDMIVHSLSHSLHLNLVYSSVWFPTCNNMRLRLVRAEFIMTTCLDINVFSNCILLPSHFTGPSTYCPMPCLTGPLDVWGGGGGRVGRGVRGKRLVWGILSKSQENTKIKMVQWNR